MEFKELTIEGLVKELEARGFVKWSWDLGPDSDDRIYSIQENYGRPVGVSFGRHPTHAYKYRLAYIGPYLDRGFGLYYTKNGYNWTLHSNNMNFLDHMMENF